MAAVQGTENMEPEILSAQTAIGKEIEPMGMYANIPTLLEHMLVGAITELNEESCEVNAAISEVNTEENPIDSWLVKTAPTAYLMAGIGYEFADNTLGGYIVKVGQETPIEGYLEAQRHSPEEIHSNILLIGNDSNTIESQIYKEASVGLSARLGLVGSDSNSIDAIHLTPSDTENTLDSWLVKTMEVELNGAPAHLMGTGSSVFSYLVYNIQGTTEINAEIVKTSTQDISGALTTINQPTNELCSYVLKESSVDMYGWVITENRMAKSIDAHIYSVNNTSKEIDAYTVKTSQGPVVEGYVVNTVITYGCDIEGYPCIPPLGRIRAGALYAAIEGTKNTSIPEMESFLGIGIDLFGAIMPMERKDLGGFVLRDGQDTMDLTGYIVMEHVGGTTLQGDILYEPCSEDLMIDNFKIELSTDIDKPQDDISLIGYIAPQMVESNVNLKGIRVDFEYDGTGFSGNYIYGTLIKDASTTTSLGGWVYDNPDNDLYAWIELPDSFDIVIEEA
jgi:hypothetical protein